MATRNLAARLRTHTELPLPMTRRSPQAIAMDIRANMPSGGPTWIYCRPYVQAMDHLPTWADDYGYDSGREIGLRFLCNAGGWRGREARRIKDEIRTALRGE